MSSTSSRSGTSSDPSRMLGPEQVAEFTHKRLPFATGCILTIFLIISVIYSFGIREPTPPGAVITSLVFTAVVFLLYGVGRTYLHVKGQRHKKKDRSQRRDLETARDASLLFSPGQPPRWNSTTPLAIPTLEDRLVPYAGTEPDGNPRHPSQKHETQKQTPVQREQEAAEEEVLRAPPPAHMRNPRRSVHGQGQNRRRKKHPNHNPRHDTLTVKHQSPTGVDNNVQSGRHAESGSAFDPSGLHNGRAGSHDTAGPGPAALGNGILKRNGYEFPRPINAAPVRTAAYGTRSPSRNGPGQGCLPPETPQQHDSYQAFSPHNSWSRGTHPEAVDPRVGLNEQKSFHARMETFANSGEDDSDEIAPNAPTHRKLGELSGLSVQTLRRQTAVRGAASRLGPCHTNLMLVSDPPFRKDVLSQRPGGQPNTLPVICPPTSGADQPSMISVPSSQRTNHRADGGDGRSSR